MHGPIARRNNSNREAPYPSVALTRGSWSVTRGPPGIGFPEPKSGHICAQRCTVRCMAVALTCAGKASNMSGFVNTARLVMSGKMRLEMARAHIMDWL